jgi:ZIP family zinc transporter
MMVLTQVQQLATTSRTRILAQGREHAIYQHYVTLPPNAQRQARIAAVILLAVAALAGLYAMLGARIFVGFMASLLAGLATGLGALPALYFKEVSERLLRIMLAGAAGVMLAATAFSLVAPGIQYGNQIWPGKGIWVIGAGMLVGAVFLDLADRYLPRAHFMPRNAVSSGAWDRIWLFIIAITLHNFPEGLAVGVSYGSDDWHNATILALAIGLQNTPEGLAVALPLVGLGYDRKKAVLAATLTGLVEPVGGLLGISAVTLFYPLLPIGMAFAAGAMLFVISEDILPEVHSQGRLRVATFSVMFGFVIMMMLDNMLT